LRLRRIRALGPIAATLAALVLAAQPAMAAGGPTVESGWWNEASAGPVAAPSTTQSNQVQVSNGLSGPLAFAAVRVGIPTATPAGWSLTLRLAPTSSTVGTPAVSACPTTSNWKPGPDQDASTAPGYSCTSGHQIDAKASGSDATWTIPVSWASRGTLSVALVPTPGTSSPFSVSYPAPTPESVTLAPPPPANPPAPSPVASGPPPAGSSGQGSAAPAPGVANGSGVGSPASPAAEVVAPAVATGSGAAAASTNSGAGPALGTIAAGTAGPTGTAANGPVAVAAPASAAPGGGTKGAGTSGHGARVMAFGLLVATGLALFFLAAQPDRVPRLLGPLGATKLGGSIDSGRIDGGPVDGGHPGVVRGVGRFARLRTTPPRRL
jgi:hypothetical protein